MVPRMMTKITRGSGKQELPLFSGYFKEYYGTCITGNVFVLFKVKLQNCFCLVKGNQNGKLLVGPDPSDTSF